MQKFLLKFHMIGGMIITVPNPDITLEDVEEQLAEHGSLSISSANGDETLIFREGVAAICLARDTPAAAH